MIDPAGKGIKSARVSILLHTPSQGSGLYRAVTDSEGMFEFRGIPTDHEYSFVALATGYGTTWVHNIYIGHDLAQKGFKLEPLTLAIADQSVSGLVVDADGKPVSGAQISTRGQGQSQHYNIRTGADGKFIVDGVCAGGIRVSAMVRGDTLLSGFVDTEGGATDIRIVVVEVPSPNRRRFLSKSPPSLVGRTLPELKNIGVEGFSTEVASKKMLLCFFDVEQRPSRHYISQMAQRAEQIKNQNLALVVIQASKIDKDRLDEWIKKNDIPFTIGMAKNDATKTRLTYGIKSLPWLILTDEEHVVRAEGFSLDELDKKVQENRNVQD